MGLQQLLVVQGHDTAADQLRHRRDAHPARAELSRIDDELVTVEREVGEVGAARDAVARRQRAAEDELASLDAKVADLDRKLYGGTISSPKELQALQADIDSLKRHASDVEDRVLAALEELEPLDARLAALAERRAALDADAVRWRTELAEAEAEIEADLAREERARADAAAGLPAELLAQYDGLRRSLGGIGAARLEPGGRCSGCHLTLPATEVARIKREPADTVFRCDQCGRILVRVDP